jgi:hypothetical protein
MFAALAAGHSEKMDEGQPDSIIARAVNSLIADYEERAGDQTFELEFLRTLRANLLSEGERLRGMAKPLRRLN